jgi:hypothetical protein
MEAKAGKYELFTSNAVVYELKRAPQPKRRKMLTFLAKNVKNVIICDKRVEDLATGYICRTILPGGSAKDALHIAAAVVHGLDFVISYNMGHIVKLKTMVGTAFINLRAGFRHIGLCTPIEVEEYDD